MNPVELVDKFNNIDTIIDDISKLSIENNVEICNVKILTIGDPHFKTRTKKDMELFVVKTIETAKKYKPDFIVNLGDTLDTHEKIHVVPLTQSIQWMEEISKISPLYLIIGNHDRPNNSANKNELHPFNGLKNNDNITVVDEVIIDTCKGKHFMFVPYVPPGKFLETIYNKIEENELDKYAAIFAHQEFYGSKMGAIQSVQGDKWPLNYPMVVTGHIHEYHRPQKNIIYTGTPMQHAFGDSRRKTVSLYTFMNEVNTKNKDDDLIEHNNNYITEERIDLGLPKKRIFKLNCQEVITWIPPQNSHIKLIIYGTNAELKSTMKLTLIKQWEKSGIKINTKTIDDNDDISHEPAKMEDLFVPFIQRLEAKIKDDPRKLKLYKSIFSP